MVSSFFFQHLSFSKCCYQNKNRVIKPFLIFIDERYDMFLFPFFFVFFIIFLVLQQKNNFPSTFSIMTGTERALSVLILMTAVASYLCRALLSWLMVSIYINLLIFPFVIVLLILIWKNHRHKNDLYFFSTNKVIFFIVLIFIAFSMYLLSVNKYIKTVNKSQEIKERYSEESEIKPSYHYIPPPVPKVEPPKQIQIKNDQSQ
ncbi:MAG: hypothetical protein LBJ67_10020 [Planctomycetaceae bacterium]|jgi:hypothetical protein|nr:hypothetical protein [Planctomycetaceae bacterium]